MRKLLSIVLLSSLALAFNVVGAQAAPLTIGELAPGVPTAICTGGPYDLAPVGQAAPPYTVSTDGVLTSWSTSAAAGAGQELTFKVYRPIGVNEYRVIGHDGPHPLVPGIVNTYPTNIPVQAGDLIGLNDDNAGSVGNACDFRTHELEDHILYASGNSADGKTFLEEGFEHEERLNVTATLQVVPTISSISPSSGSTSGGTSVVVSGGSFANVKSVSFGSTAAPFLVNSEGQITAVSPAGSAGAVPVTVVTNAGTATSGQQFTYEAPPTSNPVPTSISAPAKTCTVPKLKGKSLKASKARIKGADCQVGKLKKLKGAKAATGKVVGQNKKPGTVLPVGTVVKVTLGKG